MASWKTSKGKSLHAEDWQKIGLAAAATAATVYTGGAAAGLWGAGAAAAAPVVAAPVAAGALGTEAATGAALTAGGTTGGTAGLFGAAPTAFGGVGTTGLTAPGATSLAALGVPNAAAPVFTTGMVEPGLLSAAVPETFATQGGTVASAFAPTAGSPEAASVAALEGPGAGMKTGLFDGINVKGGLRGAALANNAIKANQPTEAKFAPSKRKPPPPDAYGSLLAAGGFGEREPLPGDPGYEEWIKRKYGGMA